jgi:hypothetical protein
MMMPTAVAGLQPRAAWHQPGCEANQALTLMCGLNVLRMHRTWSGRALGHLEWHDTRSSRPLFLAADCLARLPDTASLAVPMADARTRKILAMTSGGHGSVEARGGSVDLMPAIAPRARR